MREEEEVEVLGVKRYVFKVLNYVELSYECLIEVQCDVMLFF